MPHLNPLPPPATAWIDPPGTPALAFRQYFLSLDLLARSLSYPPGLTNAANDAAAAAAGVPVGGFYRNGSVVQVRVT